jgi:hypothetical protein
MLLMIIIVILFIAYFAIGFYVIKHTRIML